MINRSACTVSVHDCERSAWNVPAHPNSLALDARRNVLYTTIKCGEHETKDAQESVARIALDVPIIKAME